MSAYRFWLFILIATLLLSCINNSEPGYSSAPNDFPPTPHDGENTVIIVSGLDLVDFGWLADGLIYYGFGGDPKINSAEPIIDVDETAWYVYSADTKVSRRAKSPYPKLDDTELSFLERGQTVTLLNMAVSPNADKVIYTRLPSNYERPRPLPHDYIDPAEMWVAENLLSLGEERSTYPLLNSPEHLYDCSAALSAESEWFYNESLVLGSCYSDYGIIRFYFLADLLNQKIQFLHFESESGEYVPSEEIAVAHTSPSLAFFSTGGFWVVPVQDGDREINLKLTELNFLFDDRPVIAPTWSSDDQWIYYWTFGHPTDYAEYGFVEYRPWWLEKINLVTRERKIILNEQDLLALMGYDMYQSPEGNGWNWRLSPNEKELLLFVGETIDNKATLFLISLTD